MGAAADRGAGVRRGRGQRGTEEAPGRGGCVSPTCQPETTVRSQGGSCKEYKLKDHSEAVRDPGHVHDLFWACPVPFVKGAHVTGLFGGLNA